MDEFKSEYEKKTNEKIRYVTAIKELGILIDKNLKDEI